MPNILYIRVPKAGSRSILHVLGKHIKDNLIVNQWAGGDPWIQKTKIGGISDVTEDQWKITNFSFSIVRNPWERAVSLWTYSLREKYIPENTTFREYVLNIPKDTNIESKWFSGPQCQFIFDKNHKLDFIGKLENHDDWLFIRKRILETIGHDVGNLDIDINQSKFLRPTNDWKKLYDATTFWAVTKYYNDDYIRFNYSFGE
jgi:hypothetical protein